MAQQQQIRYIDPMVDFAFKRIFKDSGNKDLIIRPLNAIFSLDITDIDIGESEQLGLTEQERKSTFDMFCTTRDGKSFIIEVQLADQTFFMERAIFYSARSISHKAKRGKWDYDFKPVFFLGLMNFDIRHLEPKLIDPEQFIHKFSLREERTGELMSRYLRFAFLEVARFDKRREDCNSFEDRFLYLMKNLPTFADDPELWDDTDNYFTDLMKEATFASMTWEEQEQYIASMKQKWDYQNTIDFAENKGREAGLAEGREKGLAEGLEKGIEKGLAEGLEKGIEQERLKNARNFKKLGVSISTIAEATGLSEDQIREL